MCCLLLSKLLNMVLLVPVNSLSLPLYPSPHPLYSALGAVPNQPIIFENSGGQALSEDYAMSYTFRAYMNGSCVDPYQILLFPMTKAAVKVFYLSFSLFNFLIF
jgi:hypothetical protein